MGFLEIKPVAHRCFPPDPPSFGIKRELFTARDGYGPGTTWQCETCGEVYILRVYSGNTQAWSKYTNHPARTEFLRRKEAREQFEG